MATWMEKLGRIIIIPECFKEQILQGVHDKIAHLGVDRTSVCNSLEDAAIGLKCTRTLPLT